MGPPPRSGEIIPHSQRYTVPKYSRITVVFHRSLLLSSLQISIILWIHRHKLGYIFDSDYIMGRK